MTTRVRNRRRFLALTLFALAFVVACTSLFSRPRQGWNESYGPVVPHDSFPADCALCHAGENWHTIREDFEFDHEASTGTPLHGVHARVPCLLCHNDRGPVQRFAAQGCAGCHVDVHRAQLGQSCDDCHDETTWQPREAIARHNQTRFPLVAAHAATACVRCHPGAPVANFSGADTACATCHSSDLLRATSPDHLAQGWTSECQQCHVPISWRPALFNHPGSFPLTGGHRGHDCTACHDSNSFTGLSTDCISCHLGDYQRADDPNHVAGAFPLDCTECHGTSIWRGARFDHPRSFPLSGGHAGHDCTACHAGGGYGGLSTDCVSCHLGDYQAANDPDHQAGGFPLDCTACHGTVTWNGADFDHDFPIDGGRHGSLDCAECHTNPGNYAIFTCIDCHAHEEDDMNDEHDEEEVDGYGWISTLCYGCHPDGHK